MVRHHEVCFIVQVHRRGKLVDSISASELGHGFIFVIQVFLIPTE